MHAPDQDLAEMHVGSVGSGAWSVTLVLSVLKIQSQAENNCIYSYYI
jgi:hypothetical protein